MRRGAALLVGRHDFAAFRGAGDQSLSPLKTIRRSEIADGGGLITYTVEADSFLQYMVRNIAGTLIEVGRGRIPPERVGDILGARDRRLAGPTAPPSGLFLVEVLYGDLAPPTGG
jgi:tRNA pseudouridine38-40 synthase